MEGLVQQQVSSYGMIKKIEDLDFMCPDWAFGFRSICPWDPHSLVFSGLCTPVSVQ